MTERAKGADDAPEQGRDDRLARRSLVRRLLNRPELGAVAGAIIVLIVFLVVAGDSGMFSPRGIVNFLNAAALLGIVAVPVALLMIGGEFDLTVGSMIAFTGMTVAIVAVSMEFPLWLAILAAFVIALGIGFINGYIVIWTGLPSFIVTLGGLFILRGLTVGLTRHITGRTQVGGVRDLMAGDPLVPLFHGTLLGLPLSVVWFLILGGLATYVLLFTRFGNWIFAAGGDKNAARNVGVPVDFVKIVLFMLTAAGATLAAVITVLDAGSADTQRGLLRELEAIAAAVIGGCLLTGGYGSAVGAMLGALIFGITQRGIFYTGIPTDWFLVVLGGMLLAAVMSNSYIRRKALEGR
ncbi:ABC transporter permease [Fodinicurvata sp. EGI_FJ10296]|uniref:ABC transporter permease n=1 Tax=Fodinicurvata sp. EGI_FJ10296 TaxID=3231908 RepID=UPI00345487C4